VFGPWQTIWTWHRRMAGDGNITRPTWGWVELHGSADRAPDHAIGRSRGGWSTKVHQLVDGNGRPL
jgi:hypothetical protein